MMSKSTFITDYLDLQEKYEKNYSRDKTLVLIQNGSFYEAYSTETRGHNLNIISGILNYSVTKKNKSIKEVSEKNPYMLGFPIANLSSFLKKLVDNHYTVIVIKQVTEAPNPIKRELLGIFSPGTFIENLNPDSNYIVSVYVHTEKSLAGIDLYCIGMSALDLSVGTSVVYETYSKESDINYALDETNRFLINYMPKQLLVYGKINDFVRKYLELDERKFKAMGEPDSNFKKLSFVNKYIRQYYTSINILTPIEYLGLERLGYATLSFITLLDYVHTHNDRLTLNLLIPVIFDSDTRLILGNNAAYQLNIFNGGDTNTTINSLFDVVNNTSTAMGRRYLKNILGNPLIESESLNKTYDLVALLMKNKNYIKIEDNLKQIMDLERLARRIGLGMIHPFELLNMYQSFLGVLELSSNDILKNVIKMDVIAVKKFIKYFDDTFVMDELAKYNKNDIQRSLFKVGLYVDIDNLQKEIDEIELVINNIGSVFEREMGLKDGSLKLSRTDTEGFYIPLTKKRYDMLVKVFDTKKLINISDNFSVSVKDVKYKELTKGNTKLYITQLSEKSNALDTLNKKLILMVGSEYSKLLSSIYKQYNTLFYTLANVVAYIDYLKSNAKTALRYNYVRPVIQDNNNSFVCVKDMRHPIVERLSGDVEYVPHSLELNSSGLLVYGLNGGGKSTIMKALGLNVIMAQSGLFVPCSSFRYKPYKALFARITGEDNIFKGLSSFTLEMTELSAILKRNNNETLVIGDEICKGTESTSGTAIVAASIINLSKSGASFILATHLHDLSKLSKINELQNVKSVHLSVVHDEVNNRLIYDRKLQPGSGEKIYGYIVAKYIIQNNNFMDLVVDIKNELLNVTTVKDIESSKYNANVYVKACGVCGVNTKDKIYDTHHINFQMDCEDGFVKDKPHVPMNSEANLVVLCKECHVNVHKGLINISGYLDTTDGPILQYKIVDNTDDKTHKKSKVDETKINYILGLKLENPKITNKRMVIEYKNKFDESISATTIRKILLDNKK